jgi:Fibronectin type III domain
VFTVTPATQIGSGPGKLAAAVTPRPAPGVPTGILAVAGNGQAGVSWEAPSDAGGGPVTSYVVTAAPGGEQQTVSGSASSALYTDLVNGTSYTFTVTASNTYGTSPASAPSTPVTPVILAIAPTAVTASAGNTTATVSWTAPADNGAGAITSYQVAGNGKIVTVPGVSLQTQVWIDQLAALEIVPTPYLRASADVNADPWWTVRAGATIQGCADFLHGLKQFCTPPGWADFGSTVVQASGPFRGIAVLPAQANTVVGQQVQFVETPQHVPDGPVSWSVFLIPAAVRHTSSCTTWRRSPSGWRPTATSRTSRPMAPPTPSTR